MLKKAASVLDAYFCPDGLWRRVDLDACSQDVRHVGACCVRKYRLQERAFVFAKTRRVGGMLGFVYASFSETARLLCTSHPSVSTTPPKVGGCLSAHDAGCLC